MKEIILAIETSCDDTSIAIYKDNVIYCKTFDQSMYHRAYQGIYPKLSAELHYKKISKIIAKVIKESNTILSEITHIAYTSHPGLNVSLFIGKAAALSLSKLLDVPIIAVNHIHAHALSYSINQKIIAKTPYLGLVISGGHTSLFLINEKIGFKLLGSTLDDSVGEVLDKIGRKLNFKYPAGPIIDKLAKQSKNGKVLNTYVPIKYDTSFSGSKSYFINLINKKKYEDIYDLCKSIQLTLFSQLEIVLKKAIFNYKCKTIVVGGGVSANSYLRSAWTQTNYFGKDIKVIFPEIKYCKDNAAMIANWAYRHLKNP